jgi:hypothetical protein
MGLLAEKIPKPYKGCRVSTVTVVTHILLWLSIASGSTPGTENTQSVLHPGNSSGTSPAFEVFNPIDRDLIRWVDPDQKGPFTYLEWKAGWEAPAPMQYALVKSVKPMYSPHGNSGMAVMVNSDLWSTIRTSLELYALDVAGEDLAVDIYTVSGGTPEELRSLLQNLYAEGLEGCLLVGDLPIPWYEQYGCFNPPYQEEYPCDQFYMDLDGYFGDEDSDGLYDSHSGNVTPDIWVGRLTASPLTFNNANESELIKNYFRKNHLYRSGLAPLPNHTLAYLDDDFTFRTDYLDILLTGFVGECITEDDPWVTWDTDYENRLTLGYEFVHVWVHSSAVRHAFRNPNNLWGRTENWEIKQIDPAAYFYILCACSNARYTSPDYMAGWYVFNYSHGLAAFGSTKNGCMIYFHDFYPFLAEQKTLGQAYLDWFRAQAAGGFWEWEECYYYGLTLIGDPTLRPQQRSNSRMIHYDNEWGGPSVGFPNEYGFDLFNNRFTARKSCLLSSVLMLAIPTGSPICRIYFWNSGGTFPTTKIDSIDVELDPRSIGHWIAVDVSELGLQFSEGEDFHVGITMVDPQPGERIALHGGVWTNSLPPISSMLHNGKWAMFNQVVPDAHNFDIRVIVSEEPEPVVEITTLTIPVASLGQYYNQTIEVAGGTPPYSWDLTAGSLPDGITLEGQTGVVSGQATSLDTAHFTIRVTDSSTPSLTDIQHLTLVTWVSNNIENGNGSVLPENFVLRQNYPNPFNPSTMINYQLPMISEVELSVYSLLGQKVTILVSERQPAGFYQIEWDARNLASGVYLYRLETYDPSQGAGHGFVETRKMVLMR